jgi:hypothetical protein
MLLWYFNFNAEMKIIIKGDRSSVDKNAKCVCLVHNMNIAREGLTETTAGQHIGMS